MIDAAHRERSDRAPELPLIRLRVRNIEEGMVGSIGVALVWCPLMPSTRRPPAAAAAATAAPACMPAWAGLPLCLTSPTHPPAPLMVCATGRLLWILHHQHPALWPKVCGQGEPSTVVWPARLPPLAAPLLLPPPWLSAVPLATPTVLLPAVAVAVAAVAMHCWMGGRPPTELPPLSHKCMHRWPTPTT